MTWDGCVDRLDPKWNPRDEPDEHLTGAAAEYDQPVALATSKDDE